jgi:DNA (cytosine-5)-methyltransferase 1
MTIRFLSLFAGIGGFDLGLERAGWQCAGQVEIDSFCRRVLEKNWPMVQRFEDVRNVTGEIIRKQCGSIHAIVGGFPCQDISQAGQKFGIEGKRSGLWFEMARLISEIRPSFVIVENVSALLIRGMGRVLGDLAAIGYDAEWRTLRASDFGAPHRRSRIFIVAYPGGFFGDRPGIFERGSYSTVAQESTQWFSDGCRVGVVDGKGYRRVRLISNVLFSGMDDGLSVKMDRFRSLGNSIVPDCAQWIGERINTVQDS